MKVNKMKKHLFGFTHAVCAMLPVRAEMRVMVNILDFVHPYMRFLL